MSLAVPLSFITCPAAIGAEPGGITRRAPGRTSHPAAAGPLSAGEGPSLFFDAGATLPFLALIGHYIIIHGFWCQVNGKKILSFILQSSLFPTPQLEINIINNRALLYHKNWSVPELHCSIDRCKKTE